MIDLTIGTRKFPVKVWNFPAGEVGVKADVLQHNVEDNDVYIHLAFEGNSDLIALCQLVDIIRSTGKPKTLNLLIPYFPYGRQDRRCSEGEAHALKVIANIVNSLKFDSVVTLDPHSYVLEAVVDNLRSVPQEICAMRLPKYNVIIAPDDGASKKIYKHWQVQEGTSVVVASKRRDSGGKIISTTFQSDVDLNGVSVCVVDDLCDGGYTFIALADTIEASGFTPSRLDLYVTHGIFSKGVDILLEKFNNIYVRNLMNNTVDKSKIVLLGE